MSNINKGFQNTFALEDQDSIDFYDDIPVDETDSVDSLPSAAQNKVPGRGKSDRIMKSSEKSPGGKGRPNHNYRRTAEIPGGDGSASEKPEAREKAASESYSSFGVSEVKPALQSQGQSSRSKPAKDGVASSEADDKNLEEGRNQELVEQDKESHNGSRKVIAAEAQAEEKKDDYKADAQVQIKTAKIQAHEPKKAVVWSDRGENARAISKQKTEPQREAVKVNTLIDDPLPKKSTKHVSKLSRRTAEQLKGSASQTQSPNRLAAQGQKSRNSSVEKMGAGVKPASRRPKTSKSKQAAGAAGQGRNHSGAHTAMAAKELSSSAILHHVMAQQSSSPNYATRSPNYPTRDDRSRKTDKASPVKPARKKGPPVSQSSFSVRPKTQLSTAEELRAMRQENLDLSMKVENLHNQLSMTATRQRRQNQQRVRAHQNVVKYDEFLEDGMHNTRAGDATRLAYDFLSSAQSKEPTDGITSKFHRIGAAQVGPEGTVDAHFTKSSWGRSNDPALTSQAHSRKYKSSIPAMNTKLGYRNGLGAGFLTALEMPQPGSSIGSVPRNLTKQQSTQNIHHIEKTVQFGSFTPNRATTAVGRRGQSQSKLSNQTSAHHMGTNKEVMKYLKQSANARRGSQGNLASDNILDLEKIYANHQSRPADFDQSLSALETHQQRTLNKLMGTTQYVTKNKKARRQIKLLSQGKSNRSLSRQRSKNLRNQLYRMIQSQEHQGDIDYTGQYGNYGALGDIDGKAGVLAHNQPASTNMQTASDAKVTNSSRQSFQMPGFLNNHIENLTINAPPGFEMPAQAQPGASQAPYISNTEAAIRSQAVEDKGFELVLEQDGGMLSHHFEKETQDERMASSSRREQLPPAQTALGGARKVAKQNAPAHGMAQQQNSLESEEAAILADLKEKLKMMRPAQKAEKLTRKQKVAILEKQMEAKQKAAAAMPAEGREESTGAVGRAADERKKAPVVNKSFAGAPRKGLLTPSAKGQELEQRKRMVPREVQQVTSIAQQPSQAPSIQKAAVGDPKPSESSQQTEKQLAAEYVTALLETTQTDQRQPESQETHDEYELLKKRGTKSRKEKPALVPEHVLAHQIVDVQTRSAALGRYQLRADCEAPAMPPQSHNQGTSEARSANEKAPSNEGRYYEPNASHAQHHEDFAGQQSNARTSPQKEVFNQSSQYGYDQDSQTDYEHQNYSRVTANDSQFVYKAQNSAYQTPEQNFEEIMGSVEVPHGHDGGRNEAMKYRDAEKMIKESMNSLDDDHSEMDCQSSYTGAGSEQFEDEDGESESSSASTLAPMPVTVQAEIILKPDKWVSSTQSALAPSLSEALRELAAEMEGLERRKFEDTRAVQISTDELSAASPNADLLYKRSTDTNHFTALTDKALDVEYQSIHRQYMCVIKEQYQSLFSQKALSYSEQQFQKLYTNELGESLCDVAKQRKRLGINKKARRLRLLELSKEPKLVEVFDLNMKNCVNSITRGAESEATAKQDSDDDDELELLFKERAKNTSTQRINAHLFKRSEEMLLMSKPEYRETEQTLKTQLRSQDVPTSQYRLARSLKDGVLFGLEQDAKSLLEYTNYVDMVWQNKNNKPAFIEIKNTEALDASVEWCISLFDVMTKASVFGVYNSIDWQCIDTSTKKHHLKVEEHQNSKPQSDFADSVAQILKWSPLDNLTNFDEKRLIIHGLVMTHLEKTYCSQVRVMPLRIKLKMAFCLANLLSFINTNTFGQRYQALVDGIDFPNENQRRDQQQHRVTRRQDGLHMAAQFRDHLAYHMIHSDQNVSFYNLLFQASKQSLYMKLYDRDFDFQLHMIIDSLYENQRKGFMVDYLNELRIVDDGSFNAKDQLEFKPISRSKSSLGLGKHQMFLHQNINFKMRLNDEQKEGIEDKHSCRDESGPKKSMLVRPYERHGALDRFNLKYCEFLVLEKLQPTVTRAKDSSNMYYKKIETLIDMNDGDYNAMSRLYGYKCQLIRDPAQPQYLMEVYVPIEVVVGEQKIKRMTAGKKRAPQPQKRSRGSTSKKSSTQPLKKKKTKRKKVETQKSFAERVAEIGKDKSEAKPVGHSKIIKAVMAEELLTDDSMKGIDYQDIKSDQSDYGEGHKSIDSNSPEKLKKSKPEKKGSSFSEWMNKSKTVQTPQEFYNQMSKHRRCTDNEEGAKLEQKEVHQQKKKKVFQVLGAEELEDQSAQNNPFRVIKTKLKVERLINDSAEHVFIDNLGQLRKLKKNRSYFDAIKKACLRRGEMSELQKQVVRQGLQEAEMQTRDGIENIKYHANMQDILAKEKDGVRVAAHLQEDLDEEFPIDFDKLTEEEQTIFRQALLEEVDKLHQRIEKDKSKAEEDQAKNAETIAALKDDQVADAVDAAEAAAAGPLKGTDDDVEAEGAASGSAEQESHQHLRSLARAVGAAMTADHLRLVAQKQAVDQAIQRKLAAMLKRHKAEAGSQDADSAEGTPLIRFEGESDDEVPKELDQDSDLDLRNELVVLREIRQRKHQQQQRFLRKMEKREQIFSNLSKPKKPQKVIATYEATRDLKLGKKLRRIQNGEDLLFASLDESVDGQAKGLAEAIDAGEKQGQEAQAIAPVVKRKMLRAITMQNIGLMEDILKRYQGSNAPITDAAGNSLIALAAIQGDVGMIKLLLARGMDANTQNHQGNTPLHFAVSGRHLKCIDTLLQAQVSEDLENEDGHTAWEMAAL